VFTILFRGCIYRERIYVVSGNSLCEPMWVVMKTFEIVELGLLNRLITILRKSIYLSVVHSILVWTSCKCYMWHALWSYTLCLYKYRYKQCSWPAQCWMLVVQLRLYGLTATSTFDTSVEPCQRVLDREASSLSCATPYTGLAWWSDTLYYVSMAQG